jgi:hypothetical protein
MLCRTLQGHGHWVNILALSTDYVMRTGAFDPRDDEQVYGEQTLSSKFYFIFYNVMSYTCTGKKNQNKRLLA